MKTVIGALALCLGWTTFTSAAIIGSFVPVTSQDSSTPPSGYVSQSLNVTATTQWYGAELIMTLTNGSIFQSPFVAGFGPPGAALESAIPSTVWDTYISGPTGDTPSSAGGAVDLPGGTITSTFNTSAINIEWFEIPSASSVGSFSLGQFTLSNDAAGSFELRLDCQNQTAPFLLSGTIQNGSLATVPEVSTSVLCGIAMATLAIATRIRRTTSKSH
jgi:hypothetical protein